jgi:hypothetical protein
MASIFGPSAMDAVGYDGARRYSVPVIAKEAERFVAGLLPGSVLLRPEYDPNGIPDDGYDIVWDSPRGRRRIDVKWVGDGSKFISDQTAGNYDLVVAVTGEVGAFRILGAAIPADFKDWRSAGSPLRSKGKFVWVADLRDFPADWPLVATRRGRAVACEWSRNGAGEWRCRLHADERWNAETEKIESGGSV